MNYENVTAELAYDLIAHGAWTVHEFQAWYIAMLQKADESKEPTPLTKNNSWIIHTQTGDMMPDFTQIRKGNRLKIHLSDAVHDSEMVVYFGQRGEDSFDVRFEVEGYSAPDMHLSGLHLQEKTKENLEKAWKRIVKMAKIAVSYDLDEKSPSELHYLANVLCPVD